MNGDGFILPIQWKQINNRYMVSNTGQVKSLIGKEKIMKPYKNEKGYLIIKLSEKPIEKGKYQ